ncbi:GIY-YIG nuclease family protein [Nocardia sp. IBHARD005]|uniref:GIY-YIG nuclease family protein n=1 Tax=Nocardia sp. IBHARD005 TaxID=3457765 RepID=UPI0040588F61
MRKREKPDSATHIRCRHPLCTVRVTCRYYDQQIYLCPEHAIQVWQRVQDMIDLEATGPIEKKEKAPHEKGRIYYIRVADRVKIGYTTDVHSRLATYPPGMEVLCLRIGTKKLEAAEHRRFAEYLADGREWFIPHPDLIAAIEATRAGLEGWEADWYFPEFVERKKHAPHKVEHRTLAG